MSRIVVKNLPKSITVQQLRNHFSSKGTVDLTDVQPKYTKDGKFRQFAFIGFKNEEDAAKALEYFDNTFVNSSRIKVELCENIGSTAIKPWSKYSKQKLIKNTSDKIENEKRKTGKEKPNDETNDEIEKDPKFVEFLEVQKKLGQKPLWSNDGGLNPNDNVESFGTSDSDSESESEFEQEEEEEEPAIKEKPDSKTVKPKKKTYTVKVKGLPKKIKRKEIQQFFHPLKYLSLRIPKKCPDIAYIEFKNEKSMKKALVKHRGFLNGNRIRVLTYSTENDQEQVENKWEKNSEKNDGQEEALVETGRIFVRNLTYTCKEEDLEELFKKFGPLSEVHLPIDTFTKKIKGFAFVSFLFPEHAVKAFSELDGTAFQGRTLHLIPSKAKKEEQSEIDGTNYKQKKDAQLKGQRNNVHTWNSLFLGANAVADVMAEKYQTSKSKLLEPESKESIAVRMALGETQIVSETKDYLEKNGVHLNAFQTVNAKRSKNVIIVKNLPAKTKSKDIETLFKKHGTVQRVIMPPSGIAAIVEFEHGTEAKLAFRKLAYSKFDHVPLYLEWAPVDVFVAREKSTVAVSDTPTENEKTTELVEDQTESELGATLFVKNLHFDTNEEELKLHFENIGKIVNVTIAKKKDLRNPGQFLSMGYGFVQFKKKKYAQQALKELQHSELGEHSLELKISNRDTTNENSKTRKPVNTNNDESTKILVRNIPFEASQKEVKELFKVFGELKSIRLPQKMSGQGQHRGFGFVDFLTQQDAKRAMDSLCQSTHLYGRRLVLEWAETNDNDVETLRRKTNDTFHPGLSKSKKLKKLIEEKL